MKERVKIAKNIIPEVPNVLVCPLDWGLGHATRCVPLIRHLLQHNCRVFIAGSGRSLHFLRTEFPDTTFINLPSYRFFYSGANQMALSMLLSSPLILWGIFRERHLLKKIIRQHQIHAVISDNRFGLWSREIPCIYITHQVKIKAGRKLRFIEPILRGMHRFFIKKFDQLWIPDNEKPPTLSGELSQDSGTGINHRFIGPLSRFSGLEPKEYTPTKSDSCDMLALISGPEPQRSIFESMIVEQAGKAQKKIILLQGLPGKNPKPQIAGNLIIYSHIETPRLRQMIKNAGIVLCRPGYSSVMDLAVLEKKAFFVPTPGQTEQEYLAEYLYKQGISNYAAQKEFRLEDVFRQVDLFPGFTGFKSGNGAEDAVMELLKILK